MMTMRHKEAEVKAEKEDEVMEVVKESSRRLLQWRPVEVSPTVVAFDRS